MKYVSEWTKGLRVKLLVSSLVPVAAFAVMIGLSIFAIREGEKHLAVAYEEVIPQNTLIKEMHAQRMSLSYFLWASYAAKEDHSFKEFIDKAKSSRLSLLKAVDEYEKSRRSHEEEQAWKEFAGNKEKYFAVAERMIQLLEKRDESSLADFYQASVGGEFHKLGISLRKSSQSIAKVSTEAIESSHKEQLAATEKINRTIWGVGLLASFLMISVLGILASRIAKQISGVTTGLSDSEVHVSQAVRQLDETGQLLANSASTAAASLEETVASMTEIQSLVEISSQSARDVAQVSAQSHEEANRTRQEMTNLLASIQEIANSSKKIENIIGVIDDIAFQTNLLALNAAVEAARAGDHGKGFAVVAAAVRDLSLKSSASAKEISDLISESVQKVQMGSKFAQESEKSMQSLQSVLEKIVELSNDVASATSQQSKGITQINQALNNLDSSTQSNAASSEEISASLKQISQQMDTLGKNVGELNEIVSGDNSGKIPRAA